MSVNLSTVEDLFNQFEGIGGIAKTLAEGAVVNGNELTIPADVTQKTLPAETSLAQVSTVLNWLGDVQSATRAIAAGHAHSVGLSGSDEVTVKTIFGDIGNSIAKVTGARTFKLPGGEESVVPFHGMAGIHLTPLAAPSAFNKALLSANKAAATKLAAG